MELTIEQYEKLTPAVPISVEGKTLIYNTPNTATVWRVKTLFEKEPDTIEWLNSFEPESILYDVGANVGMYSIYAAMLRDVHVFAFEPESQNFALLNRNIFSNQLSEKVSAFPVALSDETAYDMLYLSEFGIGGSCHNFGESVNYDGNEFTAGFHQGCFATSMDTLIEEQGFMKPDYIKIDVDGLEHKVVNGATNILTEGVKSILVEINTNRDDHNGVIKMLADLGYSYREEQVAKAVRQDGPFKGTGNFIFYRDWGLQVWIFAKSKNTSNTK